MTDDGLRIAFAVLGLPIFYLGLMTFAFFLLAPVYLFWERNTLHRPIRRWPRVSVLVPAYNEERTIALSLRSILMSSYDDFEVIVINDGSTDRTEAEVEPFASRARVRYLSKPNGGKASALNHGLAAATGEIVLFTDADTIFMPFTIRNGVRYFADPRVGALGGDDTPLHPHGALQKLLVLTSHIGTGFVRRGLSVLDLLPIIPGNLGFVRADILRAIGGFREVWGEDLEITLRLHRYKVRVVYGARTKVLAECPHTLSGLWKQRVRWIRSFFKVVAMHRDMTYRTGQGPFGVFLAITTLGLLLVPGSQIALLLLLPVGLSTGVVTLGGLEAIAYLGLLTLFTSAIFATLLDEKPGDLRYLPFLLLMVPLSFFYNAVVVYSLWAEFSARPERWNKLDRRGQAVPPAPAFDPQRRRVLAGTAGAVGAGAGLLLFGNQMVHAAGVARRQELADARFTVAVHFSDWPDWREAVRSIPVGEEAAMIDDVALSAGRADWTFFRWPGHEHWWSGPQSGTRVDMLASAVEAVHERGKRAIAVLDVFASRYLEGHPEAAATDLHGRRSAHVVCSTALTEGDYGDLLVEAASGLARTTEADSLCVTELFYDDCCFDTRCLEAFRRYSGQADWPRNDDGGIDRFDPALGNWRSLQVAAITSRLAYAARAERKRYLMDVRVSRESLDRNSAENGQDYMTLLPLVDQLVVWDYFALEGLTPWSSAPLARYLARTIGEERYWHSIGLWELRHRTLGPEPMVQGIVAALNGGARNIWITPGRKLSPRHWQALAALATT